MYRWRQLSEEERAMVLGKRRHQGRPDHSPYHLDSGKRHYHITAACFEHKAHVGHSMERMSAFAEALLDTFEQHCLGIRAWALLPNHYHALVITDAVLPLLAALGKLHGRTAYQWNGEEQTRGRQVWCKAVETVMKNDAHYYATLNYIHHNPVKHGYAAKWSHWPWSSAPQFLQNVSPDDALRMWRAYPIDSYGEGWDDAHL
jgi:putative transposase